LPNLFSYLLSPIDYNIDKHEHPVAQAAQATKECLKGRAGEMARCSSQSMQLSSNPEKLSWHHKKLSHIKGQL
jgi:hypothetical protein